VGRYQEKGEMMNKDQEIKRLNRIKGAVFLAIEKARRFGTPLVVKTNGHIREIKPAKK
jgi:hypothetical protein